MTSMYALVWTQHSKGSQNIRTMAMVQLLLGNIGVAGGGMNALRGHSNIQGLTDLGLMSNLIPGYMTLPGEEEISKAIYLKPRGFKPLRPGQLSYWQNYPKFFVSFLKSMYGKEATADNDFRYDWLPKLDLSYDVLRMFELMHRGKKSGDSKITAAAFRDRIGTGRKLAIQILEFFDRTGITVREGDSRRTREDRLTTLGRLGE
jgi:formate dehydrogenase major subunit